MQQTREMLFQLRALKIKRLLVEIRLLISKNRVVENETCRISSFVKHKTVSCLYMNVYTGTSKFTMRIV